MRCGSAAWLFASAELAWLGIFQAIENTSTIPFIGQTIWPPTQPYFLHLGQLIKATGVVW
jgi:hypothetical protein